MESCTKFWNIMTDGNSQICWQQQQQQNHKKDSKLQFRIFFHSQEWPLRLLNWWNSVHCGKNLMSDRPHRVMNWWVTTKQSDGAHRVMNWSVTMKQRQTSSKTTQCPALSACRNGPSRQAKAPPFPPSTGKSAPNKSVTSCRPKIASFKKTLGQSVDKSKPVINCWGAIFRSRRP